MRLEALRLAVQYHSNMPASAPNNPNMVVDTANTFMAFLKQPEEKADNPDRGPAKNKAKRPNLDGMGQPKIGPQ